MTLDGHGQDGRGNREQIIPNDLNPQSRYGVLFFGGERYRQLFVGRLPIAAVKAAVFL
jgi:hypothetical protein